LNRRSFITSALAGLAAVPLLGKLAQAQPQTYAQTLLSDGPTAYFPLDYPPIRLVCGPMDQINRIWYGDIQVYDDAWSPEEVEAAYDRCLKRTDERLKILAESVSSASS
jgi:hypothetical protein